ncbi:hypothetical protein M427DRAFT_245243 [Gonapodya prolifera JEL478]|uniref:RING-type domain-containing protein n=1 Tax=Gonapodya prolifera (strain JEL478) TaxID=1344416 RepID=A0A139ALX3_GONPJ|nr:hypothetical protein M427DRAFT_245243 [Gonapodya prolifera JEL478]|eukprot:KXS17759.1 hypothetical protein M427DRAFT_245243 [Gonapodya prolifera JEL478]
MEKDHHFDEFPDSSVGNPFEDEELDELAVTMDRRITVTCPVCKKDPFSNPVVLPCGSSCCLACLTAIVATANPSDIADHPAIPHPHPQKTYYKCPVPDCPYGAHLYSSERSDFVVTRILQTYLTGRDSPVLSSKDQEADASRIADVAGEEIRDFPHIPQEELECPVCYNLLNDPLTTPCGHTTCRSCLLQAVEHMSAATIRPPRPPPSEGSPPSATLPSSPETSSSNDFPSNVSPTVSSSPFSPPPRSIPLSNYPCPTCRSSLPSLKHLQHRPPNKTLLQILLSQHGIAYRRRSMMLHRELTEKSRFIGIFVCSLVLPTAPCYLHVFEPRYRLLMNRAMESSRRFGMCYPADREGNPAEYGTMLEIRALDPVRSFRNEDPSSLPRCLVSSVALYRFRIVERGATQDGYHTALVQRVEDDDDSDEIAVQGVGYKANVPQSPKDTIIDQPTAEEAAMFAGLEGQTSEPDSSAGPGIEPATTAFDPIHTAYNETRRLVQLQLMQLPPLERRQLLAMHGPLPPAEDMAGFSYWLAGILPVSEWSKYQLLKMTSPRERMRIVSAWAREGIERGSGPLGLSGRGSCNVM